MGSDIADEQLTESAASRTVEIGLGGASCSKPMEIEKRLQNCNWEESMTALRADFPIFKNSTSDMDYLCGIVLAIYFFDYSLKDSESTLRWSSTAMSALPDLVCRLTGVVGALSQGSGPLCGLLESVTGVSPSLVSVFGKLPSTLVMQYSERLSDGASRSLISCLKVSYRALLADRGNRSHHRSRFSIHIRSYKSWLPVAEFDRGGSDTGRLGKLGGRFPATMKSRAALTSKSRQAQEAAALTSTVGKLSNELASLNRKAKEFANSQRKAELEIRRLRNERKYDQQALVECRTSLHKILRKCEEQQAYNQSCINQQAHNLSRMSVEMDALHNQVCSLEEKNACLASDTALVQLSVSKSHESHLEALSYVNKNVAEFSQNIDNLRNSVVLRSPNWFVNLLNESVISLPIEVVSTTKFTLLGHLANLTSKMEAQQGSYRALEFKMEEEALLRRREIDIRERECESLRQLKEEALQPRREIDLREREWKSLRQRMDLYDLSSLLLPIFRIVELKVPNLFPDYLAQGPITWLLDFPILLRQAFPQLEDFDFSDPSHSGWLQLMVKKCIGKTWHQNTL
jgi:hypothetical protein